MACFLRGNIDRPHKVKVYLNAKKGTSYPKYDGSVQVFGQDEEKIEESVHGMFKPPKEIPPWIMAAAQKRKELLANQKREKEPKRSIGDRFYALSNIRSFYPVAEYLEKDEARALAGTSKDIAEVIHRLPKEIVKKVKVDSLARYLKPYKGTYQDYEDSEGREVMYPTSVIKLLIKMAYQGETFDKIVKALQYPQDEIKTMLYDHYENRMDIDHPKPYLKELLATQKREKEPKRSMGDRFYALSNISSFYPVAEYLDKYDRDVLSAVSPEVASKVEYNRLIYPNTTYSKEDTFGALNYLGQIMHENTFTFKSKNGSYNDKEVLINILDIKDIDLNELKPLINRRLTIGSQVEQLGDLDDRMEDIRTGKTIMGGWVLVQANHKVMVVVDKDTSSYEVVKWINHFALVCFRYPQYINPMVYRKKSFKVI